jgi:DNA polymerase-3 subunit gamma/tau
MVLVRLCHAADLPTPDEALRALAEGSGTAAPPANGGGRPAPTPGGVAARSTRGQAAPRLQAQPSPEPADRPPQPALRSFDDVIARAEAARERLLVFALERHVRPVRFEPGLIEIALTPEAERDLPQRLMQALKDWTGERWMVSVAKAEGGETVHETRMRGRAALMETVTADPLVRSVLERFPGAEIVGITERAPPAEEAFDPGLPDPPEPDLSSDEDL